MRSNSSPFQITSPLVPSLLPIFFFRWGSPLRGTACLRDVGGPDVDTFCTVYKGIPKQHQEENPQQGWSKDIALLYSTADWEGTGGGPIEADCTLHALVKGGDDRQELWRAANLLVDLEEPASAYQVKSFGEVHKCEEQWLLLLSTLLLQLTEVEDHVHFGPPGSEATL